MLSDVRFEDYGNYVQRLFPLGNQTLSVCREVTFQITDGCNLRCSYCYEHHKGTEIMSIETGKKIVDYVLDTYEKNESDFINHNTKAVVLSFIGGEPLIAAGLIEQICDYWFDECYRREIPLAPYTRISFATNGILWFSAETQHLIQKYHEMMSVTVSIDGVKKLHDMYRLDEAGHGSFERAYAAFCDGKKYGWHYSKMTFVPGSFPYLANSVKMMIEEGCEKIACNYAYEPTYTAEDARLLFYEVKKLADWIIDNHKDVVITMLDNMIGRSNGDDKNFCGGTGNMLAFAPDGKAYPCIRYAPVSIGQEKAANICLGDCREGLYKTEHQQAVKASLDAITMSSQSPGKCLSCPVASGCGWCSGLNYELFGTANKRHTGICLVHKARVLATCYYYNRRYLELGDVLPKRINLPLEEAYDLIGNDAVKELCLLEMNAAMKYLTETGGMTQ